MYMYMHAYTLTHACTCTCTHAHTLIDRLEEAQSQLLESQVEIETLQQTITDHEQQVRLLIQYNVWRVQVVFSWAVVYSIFTD